MKQVQYVLQLVHRHSDVRNMDQTYQLNGWGVFESELVMQILVAVSHSQCYLVFQGFVFSQHGTALVTISDNRMI